MPRMLLRHSPIASHRVGRVVAEARADRRQCMTLGTRAVSRDAGALLRGSPPSYPPMLESHRRRYHRTSGSGRLVRVLQFAAYRRRRIVKSPKCASGRSTKAGDGTAKLRNTGGVVAMRSAIHGPIIKIIQALFIYALYCFTKADFISPSLH